MIGNDFPKAVIVHFELVENAEESAYKWFLIQTAAPMHKLDSELYEALGIKSSNEGGYVYSITLGLDELGYVPVSESTDLFKEWINAAGEKCLIAHRFIRVYNRV